MILPSSYETILDKIKQDWFEAGWDAATEEHEAWLARDYEREHEESMIEDGVDL